MRNDEILNNPAPCRFDAEKVRDTIQKIAEEIGFDLVGVAEIASSAPLPRNDSAGDGIAMANNLDEWVKNGYHGEMKWFAETVEKRKDILKVMPEAKSVICVAMNYYCDTNNASKEKSVGKIARYARGRDYHKIFDKKLKLFIKRLEEEEILRYSQDDKGKELKFKYYCDTGPVLERAWAVRAGLGFVGKNTNLITKYGSWVLLGEIITNIEIKNPKYEIRNSRQINTQCHPRECGDPEINLDSRFHGNDKTRFEFTGTCGSCHKCLDTCPTGALVAPYTVDARKCISYLTIEYKGEIPIELREKMGNRIFGCDACQEVCPFNIGRQKEAKNELAQKVIAGSAKSLKEILSIKTDEEFLNKFAGFPLMRAKRRGLVRNACIAAGNSGDESLLPYLEECLKDKEPIIASHAKWAIKKIRKMIK